VIRRTARGFDGLTVNDAVAHSALDVHPLQHGRHDFNVLVAGAFNGDLSAGDRRTTAQLPASM
jgi:hypothetical protein